MSKQERIAAFARQFAGQGTDPRYAGYFALFNQQQFYEAHDVLEDLWLADKHGADGNFYKGLIQLAGAFVHLQKHRLHPAAALFNLAKTNLERYPSPHHQLDVSAVLEMIATWAIYLQAEAFTVNPLRILPGPRINPLLFGR